MSTTTQTQVIIIGGGPSGLMLSHILQQQGIDSIILERTSRQRVLQRIRAGVLEDGTVQMLREHGLGQRLDAEGSVHNGTGIVWGGHEQFFIDVKKHTGRTMMAYGQTAITEDLYAARDAAGGLIIEEVADVVLHEVTGRKPWASYQKAGVTHRIEADFIAGCDGFHGVSRRTIPASVLRTFEKVYPFGWLGVMSRTPPVPEIIYANHPDGFAMCSQRNPMLSRYYVQCPLSDTPDDWSDDRFWDALTTRMGPALASQIETGPSIEKSIAPLRSFVAEPMRWGQLFLVGDAAHIVPPTGAKGLNLAFSDVFYLSRALIDWYRNGRTAGLDGYSDTALRRVWSATRLSWWLTNLLHRFPDQTEIDQRLQEAELDFLKRNEDAQRALAMPYVGEPF
ncbi:MAG: 4-hydroxybenzoate 3-monooxygenase [Thiothrix sp.]|nr:4-hydroxybenzoate 3-monooxygenase [Thiothrix sp.]HPE61009.1 4-hydroxybenzoate 3-monooxygenase [Thiolinea sp.]